ncbi:uncharacterized protein CCR75_007726 [Bremia lactucae]|uniref:Uncharacterized protein n=1 Tax=Bremia lactucae TaxID=4779 RepID=A0A976IK64_BRELC|nr:hypothetical protein CCR75_007726 [Bremia lactucae]
MAEYDRNNALVKNFTLGKLTRARLHPRSTDLLNERAQPPRALIAAKNIRMMNFLQFAIRYFMENC